MDHKDTILNGMLTMLAALLFLVKPAVSQPRTEAVALPAPVRVDGSTADWPEEMFSNPASGFQYVFGFDREALYLCVEAADTNLQNRILLTGLHARFRKNRFSPAQTFAMPTGLPENERPDDPMALPLILANLQRVKQQVLAGMTGHLPETYRQSGKKRTPIKSAGIQANAYFDDQGVLFYEAAIPWAWFNLGKPPGSLRVELATGALGRPVIPPAIGMTESAPTRDQQIQQRYWNFYREFSSPITLKKRVTFR